MEPTAIELDVRRQGASLLLTVMGLGRGHKSDSTLENPDAWLVQAHLDGAPLKKVLAGPARISREPAGAAMGDQWNVSVSFLIGFAVPVDGRDLRLAVRAPDGQIHKRNLELGKVAAAVALRAHQ